MTNSETMAADRTPFYQGYKHPRHCLLYLVALLMIDINNRYLYNEFLV